MHITIINDCSCPNTLGRQVARAALLTDASVFPIGVPAFADLAAAGNLIDALDAHGGKLSAIIANVAPRHGLGKEWENGTPFCTFSLGNTIVVATVGGYTLSLVKKLGLVERVSVLDIHSCLKKMVWDHVVSDEEAAHIAASQFRSFDFAPRVASYLLHGNELPATLASFEDLEIPDVPHAVWYVDNFGNVKTTLLPEEVDFAPGKRVTLATGDFVCFEHLSDVSEDEAGLIVGSSGIGEHRFLEVVVQGGRAEELLNISLGDVLLSSEPLGAAEHEEAKE
ncbi:hypothetical protein GVX82_02565 [Patescibacteria group bacterium]|jgi:hypothetical protein|nr:hypothetical protein [Patescibacteria group bacterium]